MVQLRSDHDPLRLRLFPLRLACTRESHPAGHHPIQSDSAKRSPTPRSFPPAGSGRTRQPVPPPLHGIRIPRQSRLHDLLADGIPPCFRPLGSCVSSVPSSLLSSQPIRKQITTHADLKLTAATQFSQPTLLPLRPLLPPLHRHRHSSDRLLLTGPLALLWRPLRIPTPDVHQLVLGRRGRGELDRVLGCLFRFVRCLSLDSPKINRVVKERV
jgi:hypothetical protein